MPRLKPEWVRGAVLVGLVAVAGACANGGGGDDSSAVPQEGGGGSVAEGGTAPDATSGQQDGSGSGDDGTTPGADTGSVGGDDTSTGGDTSTGDDGATGADGSTGADAETDAGAADAEADTSVEDTGVDSSVEDAGFDAGHDAGHDAGFDAGHDAGFDAGHDAGFDAGFDAGVDAGCLPATATPKKTVHAPATAPGSCTPTQITDYDTQCFGPSATTGTCNTWFSNFPVCATCLDENSTTANPTNSTWGPELDWPETSGAIANVNIGGCIIVQYGSAANACGHDFEYLMECEHQECDTSCGGTIDDFNACTTNADNGPCQTIVTAINTDCAAYTNSTCWPGASSTFDSVLIAAGTAFCQ